MISIQTIEILDPSNIWARYYGLEETVKEAIHKIASSNMVTVTHDGAGKTLVELDKKIALPTFNKVLKILEKNGIHTDSFMWDSSELMVVQIS